MVEVWDSLVSGIVKWKGWDQVIVVLVWTQPLTSCTILAKPELFGRLFLICKEITLYKLLFPFKKALVAASGHGQIKAGDICDKEVEELLKQLEVLKVALSQLHVLKWQVVQLPNSPRSQLLASSSPMFSLSLTRLRKKAGGNSVKSRSTSPWLVCCPRKRVYEPWAQQAWR